MRFIWHSKTPHKIATFSGIGTMHLCKNHVSISSYSQQGVRPVSVAGRWSCLEKLRISYLWANFLCWVVWDVPCSLFLSLSLGMLRMVMRLSGNYINLAFEISNEEWVLRIVILSIHPCYEEHIYESRVTPSKMCEVLLKVKLYFHSVLPKCLHLALASYVSSAGYHTCCTSKNPSALQDRSRGLLL